MNNPLSKDATMKPDGPEGTKERIERARRLWTAGRLVESAHLYEVALAEIVGSAPTEWQPEEKARLIVQVTLALAEIYAGQAQFDSALRMVEMALCYNPSTDQRVSAVLINAEALWGMGKTAEAVKALTAAVQSAGGRLPAARVVARLLAAPPKPGEPPGHKDRLQQCTEIFSEIVLSDSGQKSTPTQRAEAWTILGMMAHARGNRPQAIEYLNGALSAVPNYPEALRMLIEANKNPRVVVLNPPVARPKPPPCKPLLASANRLLYSRNAFRITGLPVDAGSREIARHADRLKILTELNQSPAGDAMAFAPRPAPTMDEIRDSLQRLKEPPDRAVDELFWFWPEEFGQSREDKALQALRGGDEKAAVEIWLERECDHPLLGMVATHNLAVYWHCKALDQENQSLTGNGPGKSRQEIDTAWSLALGRWAKLADNNAFWDRARARMRLLDAERLTDSFCESMRGWVLQALDQASGDLAMAFGQAGRMQDAHRQARRIEQSEALRHELGMTCESVLVPTKKRLEQQASVARSQGQQNVHNAAALASELFRHVSKAAVLVDIFISPAARSNPSSQAAMWKTQFFKQATDTCAELMQSAVPRANANPRVRLDEFANRVMPEWRKCSDAATRDLANPIANRLIALATEIGAEAFNAHKDSQTAVEAFELAMQVCDDPTQKAKLGTDLDTLKKSLVLSQCHYCHRAKADQGKEVLVWMWGDRQTINNVINFKHTKASIPRCQSCKALHFRCLLWTTISAFFCGFLAKAICELMGSPVAFPAWMLAGIGGGLAMSQWFLRRHNTNDASDFKSFAHVSEWLRRGWQFGRRPDNWWNPRFSRWARFWLAGVAGAIFAAWFPQSPPVEWVRYEWAVMQNGEAAYEKFLSAFPMGDDSNDVRSRLNLMREKEEWKKIVASGYDQQRLRDYVGNFPGGEHSVEASGLIKTELEQQWAALESSGTLDEVRIFRKANPDYGAQDRVKLRFEELLWNQALAEKNNDSEPKILRELLESLPQSRHASEAKDRLCEISEKSWSPLKDSPTEAGLKSFIGEFQGCPRAQDAKVLLLRVRNGWMGDLATERIDIQAAQVRLQTRREELANLDRELSAARSLVDTRNQSAVYAFNQRIEGFGREIQEEKRAEEKLNQRIKIYNERRLEAK